MTMESLNTVEMLKATNFWLTLCRGWHKIEFLKIINSSAGEKTPPLYEGKRPILYERLRYLRDLILFNKYGALRRFESLNAAVEAFERFAAGPGRHTHASKLTELVPGGAGGGAGPDRLALSPEPRSSSGGRDASQLCCSSTKR